MNKRKRKLNLGWRLLILQRMKLRKMDGYTDIEWPYKLTPVQRAWLEESQGCTVETIIPMFEEDCYEHIKFKAFDQRKEWKIDLGWTIMMRCAINRRKNQGYNYLDWPIKLTPVQEAWLRETQGCSVESVIPMFEEDCYEHIQFA